MSRMCGIGLGLGAAACVALGAQTAQATECSDAASKILDLSATATGLIPGVGSVASAGIAMSGTLVCEEDEPLNTDAVLSLIRTELDEQAAHDVELAVDRIYGEMRVLSDQLVADYPGVDLETLDPNDTGVKSLVDQALGLDDDIFLGPQLIFSGPMSAHNNARTTYDLGPAIMLSNAELMLVQLAGSLDPSPANAGQIQVTAASLLPLIEDYRTESNRLRGMHIDVKRTIFTLELTLMRSGAPTGVSFETSVFGLTSSNVDLIEQVQTEKIEKDYILPLLNQLDQQDEHLALLEARALALLEDPFASLADLTVTMPTAVWLRNASADADERCLFNRKGLLRTDGTLQNGATRMRHCDILSSHQEWRLEDNGQIRTALADLCLTATSDSSIVKIQPCNPTDAPGQRQVWTRHGDQFRVTINGSTRCLSPSNGGLNSDDHAAVHTPCDETDDRQQWLVYAPLRHGKRLDLSDVDSSSLSLEQIRTIATHADMCVQNKPINIRLTKCSRGKPVLWAHADDGTIRQFVGDLEEGMRPWSETDLAITTDGAPVPFIRSEAPDGSVTFTNAVDGTMLFPGADEANSSIFSDAPVTDAYGDLDGIMFWRHTNGGKFAE